MSKYLVEMIDPSTEDKYLLQIEQNSLDAAKEEAQAKHPNWVIHKVKHTHGGVRAGSGKPNSWGEGVKTKTCRVPESVADNAKAILNELGMVQGILECWEDRVNESKSKSKDGQPSERYKHVEKLLLDLRAAMEISGSKLY